MKRSTALDNDNKFFDCLNLNFSGMITESMRSLIHRQKRCLVHDRSIKSSPVCATKDSCNYSRKSKHTLPNNGWKLPDRLVFSEGIRLRGEMVLTSKLAKLRQFIFEKEAHCKRIL